MNDDLPDRLRGSAESFEPDRGRMWSRVSDGMREVRAERAGGDRTRWRAPLAALATGAAVVLIGGMVVLGQTIGIGPILNPTPNPPAAGGETPSAGPPETTPEGEGDTSSGGAEPGVDGGESTSSEGAETTSAAASEDAFTAFDAWIDQGSNEYWTQVNMRLENEVPLTEVTVELRLALGEGLDHTGAYSTNNTRFSEAVVTEEDGFLVYRWTLRDDQVLAPDEYQLAAQISHETWRDAAADAFTVHVVAESGESDELTGGVL